MYIKKCERRSSTLLVTFKSNNVVIPNMQRPHHQRNRFHFNGIQNTGVELPFSLCGKELYFCVTFAFRCSRRRLGNCTLRNQTENSLCIQWLGWKKHDYRRAFTCISSSRKGVHSWIMYVKYVYTLMQQDLLI